MRRKIVQKILATTPFFSSSPRNTIQTRRKNDICFIHIPKTGGKSLIYALQNQIEIKKLNKNFDFKSFTNCGAVTFGHIHYLSLQKAGFVSDEYHNSSYKFAIVRNPYDRIVSLYNYLSNRSELDGWGFDHFLDQVLIKRPPVGLYNKAGLSQTNPQSDWIMGENGDLITNEIFKLEELDKLHNTLSEILEINLKLEVKRNISKNIIISIKDLTDEENRIEKINEIYKRDFLLFSYDMI